MSWAADRRGQQPSLCDVPADSARDNQLARQQADVPNTALLMLVGGRK
jgi:hypothetical protein